MKCFECGEVIENDVYICPGCGIEYSEEDILLMLHIAEKEKHKQAVKKLLLFTVVFFLLAAVIGISGGLWLKKSHEKSRAAKYGFEMTMRESLSKAEGVEHFAFNTEGIGLTVNREEFLELSETDREAYVLLLQQQIMELRYAAGLNQANYYKVQIFDEDGELLIYTDEYGNVVECIRE